MSVSIETPEQPSASIEDRIVEATRRSLLEHGMQKTRVEQIAAEVGLARPNVYRYFPSKNALVLEVLLRETREIHRERRRQLPIKGPVADLLVESLLLGFRLSLETVAMSICLAEDSHLTAQLLTQPAAVTVETEYWQPLLQHGRLRGEITPGLDDEQIVRWFLGVQILLHEHAELFGGEHSRRECVTKLVVPGLLTSRGLKTRTVSPSGRNLTFAHGDA